MVSHLTHNQKITGSSPVSAPTTILNLEKWICVVGNSVQTQCDVAAEKRRKALGGNEERIRLDTCPRSDGD